MLAINAIKDRIMARLKIPHPGPGFLHFPEWATDEYFGQLTAESKVPVPNRRTYVTRYYCVKNQERNEALDLTVYAHAALWILQNKIDPKTFRDLSALHSEVSKDAASRSAESCPPASSLPAFCKEQ